jgi:cellulose synthase/poly-beta-1,6-N-acetylglucosamine synthase-like glycosyltransferase
MGDITTVIFYILVFLAIYLQVFLLTVFFEKRDSLKALKREPKEFPGVTFLIPCYNEEKTIEGTIKSILSLDYPKEKLKIIAIDDGSADNTWNILQKYENQENIRILKKENGGKHTALNLALLHVDTPLVVSFDADTEILKDAVKKAVVYFENDEELMALGGAVLISKPKTFVQKAQSIEYQMFSFSKKMLGLLGGVLVVPGAFSMFRVEAFEKIGGYKDAHKLEDLELTFRMQVAGLKVDHSHDAFVYTKGPETAKALFKQRLRWGYGFINNMFDYRHAIFNKKYGNFGFFTLPMGIISYMVILNIFFITWYHIVRFFIEKSVEVNTLGFGALMPSSFFDFFFVNTEATAFLTLFMYGTIFLTIYLGGKVSKIGRTSFLNLLCFLIVYSALVPLWVLKAVYNTIFGKKVAWR